ncbi:L-asparaginase [Pleurostoma richardsiae]|uniref:asparaginase n=1 Tax=Pleurostoma richardsiae TaxID=41990 RepID=A0AA38RRM7_9PEZI|nr:L-asparaginase [Pleurostoma richardsiae]
MSARNFLSLAACAAVALAVPTPLHEPLFILSRRDTSTTFNASLPNITIYATGGTIAGSAGSSAQTTGYQAGALGVDILIDAVPELLNVSNVEGVQVANVASEAITPEILLNISHHIQEKLNDPYCQGVVVTHGTDTLEESAFFLDLTIRSEKPVVFVGAMRPATAISADGPINLLEAVTLAGSPSAKGRGAMIVLNDRIASAWYTTKTNANAVDTFKAYEMGFLGFFIDIKPIFYYQPSLPIGKQYFDVTNTTELPQVDILYGYQSLNPALATAAVESGAKGLVLAGMGAGGWTDDGSDAIDSLVANNGTQVVVSRRTMDGYVEAEGTDGYYGGGFLNPPKARILLQLAINAGYSPAQMQTVFEYDG